MRTSERLLVFSSWRPRYFAVPRCFRTSHAVRTAGIAWPNVGSNSLFGLGKFAVQEIHTGREPAHCDMTAPTDDINAIDQSRWVSCQTAVARWHGLLLSCF